jgi:hypothetical protein
MVKKKPGFLMVFSKRLIKIMSNTSNILMEMLILSIPMVRKLEKPKERTIDLKINI